MPDCAYIQTSDKIIFINYLNASQSWYISTSKKQVWVCFLLYIKKTQVHWLKINCAWIHFCKIVNNNITISTCLGKDTFPEPALPYICIYPPNVWFTTSPDIFAVSAFSLGSVFNPVRLLHVKCVLWSQWKLCMWERFMVCGQRGELQMWV